MSDAQNIFDQFISTVKSLRSENGCPWDRRQSPSSLKKYLLEETQELIEAIDSGNKQHVKEELGDLLYLIVLLSQIHHEQDYFAIDDVIDAINAKMIRRHPHVFDDEKVESTEELRKKWLEIKSQEKTGCSHIKKI